MVSGLGFVVEAAVGVGEVWPEPCTCFGPPAMVVVPPESALSPPLGAVAVLCGAGAEVTPGTLGATTVLWLAVVGTGLGLPVVAAGTVAAEVPSWESDGSGGSSSSSAERASAERIVSWPRARSRWLRGWRRVRAPGS